MIYKTEYEFDVETFGFWAGAKDVVDRCWEEGRIDELQSLIEYTFCDKVPTENEINDFVQFDAEQILFDEENREDEE